MKRLVKRISRLEITHAAQSNHGGLTPVDVLPQANRVRDIYDARLAQGHRLIAIAGDLNEAPV